MNIGFWNLRKKELSDSLVDLTKENQLDIICLAEVATETIPNFITKINSLGITNYQQIPSPNDKLIILSNYSAALFTDKNTLYQSTRWNTQYFEIPNVIKLNIITVHFPDKTHWSEASLALECAVLATDIAIIEKNTNCTNTILIGDFNMNPFENGLVAANGLNAISDLSYSHKKKNRIVNGVQYNYFYNPMWNFFGDFKEPLGTYYYKTAGHISYQWHIYDQVIFRPHLSIYLAPNKSFVEIVTKIAGDSLIDAAGRPDSKNYSDHLPIIFKLTF